MWGQLDCNIPSKSLQSSNLSNLLFFSLIVPAVDDVYFIAGALSHLDHFGFVLVLSFYGPANSQFGDSAGPNSATHFTQLTAHG